MKAEVEGAQRAIEKMKQEKKAMKQKIKVKNAVVMQQEQQIQQRQEQIDEQGKGILELRRDNDRKEAEIREMSTQMNIMKQKLEEAQKSLDSNQQMILWLNKQINEKPSFGGSLLPPTGA